MRSGRRAAVLVTLSLITLALLAGVGVWFYRHERGAAGAAPTAARASPAPLASLDDMLNATNNADWRVARLRSNPQILVIEFPELRSQAQALNRLAALTEKLGAPRDRVLSNPELDALIKTSSATAETYYFGHDYRDTSVAYFFNLAEHQQLALNPEEQRLRQLLLDQQLITTAASAPAPGVAATLVTLLPGHALVSFTRVHADDPATPTDEAVDQPMRETVLRHELSHGQYFTRPDYRAHCWAFWRNVLNEPERQAFKALLVKLGYDTRDEDLIVNETQALLMHTPDPRAFNAADASLPESRLRTLRERFMAGVPANVMPPAQAASP